ncbi:MAG: phage tail tape measure protein [Anaerolineae bacterium]
MADEELQAKITLDAQQFSVGVGQIVAQLGTLDGAIQSLGTRLENTLDKKLGSVGAQLQGINLDKVASKLTASAEAMKEAFGNVVQPAIAFEAAMNRVNTVAKLSDADLATLSDQMRTLGQTIGISIAPTEAAAAQYDILSAGFTDTAAATEILTQAAIASRGGMTSTAAAADVLTSALNAYGVGADQAKRFNDVLFTGVEKGKLTFEDFVSGLGQVVPAAAANNVSIEEISAAMAALTAAGQQPARAFTGLNAAIVQLSSPTNEASKAAASLGIDLSSAAFKGLSLVEKLQLLAQTAGENKSVLRKVLGDVNALGVAYSLAGNGAKTYADAMEATAGPSNAAANAAKTMEKGVEASQKRFEAASQALKIAVSEAILPALSGIADVGTGVIQFFDSFSPLTKAAAGAAFALGTAVTVTAGFLAALAVSVKATALALGIELPAASTIASGAMARVSGAAVATRQSILGVNLAAAAGPAGLILLGAAAVKAALDYAALSKAADEAADNIVNVGGKALKGTNTTVSTGAILSSSPADLKKQGVTQADVQNRIRELRETLEQAAAAGDTQTAKVLEGKVKKLIAIREQLDQPSAAEKVAAGGATSDKVKNFKLDTVVDTEALKKAAEERKKQALFEIETGKLTGEQKIAALEALIAREKLAGDERRGIEQKVFQIREKLQSDATQAGKKAADEQKANEFQAIDLSKASHQQKIQQLGALLVKYKDQGETRRRIEQEIAREQDAIAKDQEDKRKQRAEDAKKAQEDANQQTQEQRGARQDAIGLRKDAIGTEIDKAKEKGGAGSLDSIGTLLAERQKLTEETIRLQLAEQLATTKSADAKVQLEKNAEERIRQEQQKTADEFKRLKDQQIADQKRLDEAKDPKKKFSTEFTGAVLTPEELAKQQAERFGPGAGNEDFRARQLATQAEAFAKRERGIQLNLAEAQRKGIDVSGLQPLPQKTLQNLNPPPQAQTLKLEHVIDIRLTREDGSTQTQRVTVAGVPGPAQGANSVNFGTRGRA